MSEFSVLWVVTNECKGDNSNSNHLNCRLKIKKISHNCSIIYNRLPARNGQPVIFYAKYNKGQGHFQDPPQTGNPHVLTAPQPSPAFDATCFYWLC